MLEAATDCVATGATAPVLATVSKLNWREPCTARVPPLLCLDPYWPVLPSLLAKASYRRTAGARDGADINHCRPV